MCCAQKWNRPENMDDDNYVAEVQVNVDKQGNLSMPKWLKGSGNEQWDADGEKMFSMSSRTLTVRRRPIFRRRDHPF